MGAARLVATRTKGLLLGATQSGTEHHAAFEHGDGGHGGPSLAAEGTTTGAVFEAYVERVLCPVLCPGQIVVMDNLSAHKGERVRELIEARGCEVLYLPPYSSPDLNPIEEAFAKIKGVLRKAEARNREALIEAIGRAISAVTSQDVRGFFEHCGYGVSVQSL